MGFIARGQFYLLFHAGCPLKPGQVLGVDVPKSFVPLTIHERVVCAPRKAGIMSSESVHEIEIEAKASATGYAPSLRLCPACLRNVPRRTPVPRSKFSLELTGKPGAALVTRYPTYIENAKYNGTFSIYTDRYYESWLEFADKKGYEGAQPFLVSGVEVTKDVTMMAYANGGTNSSGAGFIVTLPFTASASTSGSTRKTWSTNPLEYRQWPLEWDEEPMDIPSKQATPPAGFDCCVFIRYHVKNFKGGKGGWLSSRSLRFPAGNLRSGGNRGDTFPGSTAQPGGGDAASGEGLGEGWDDVGETDRGVSYVRLQPRPFISTLTFVFRIWDITTSMALQPIYTR